MTYDNNIYNIYNILNDFSKEIDFDFGLIYRIYLVTYDKLCEWKGKVDTLNINNKLCFELLLHKDIIDDLQSADNEIVHQAKSIIFHELYHCKEMYITSQNTPWVNIYFHEPITTTKLLLLKIGFQQWSEYYAYYNSSKIHEKKYKLKI